jgi:hypothetical protein
MWPSPCETPLENSRATLRVRIPPDSDQTLEISVDLELTVQAAGHPTSGRNKGRVALARRFGLGFLGILSQESGREPSGKQRSDYCAPRSDRLPRVTESPQVEPLRDSESIPVLRLNVQTSESVPLNSFFRLNLHLRSAVLRATIYSLAHFSASTRQSSLNFKSGPLPGVRTATQQHGGF